MSLFSPLALRPGVVAKNRVWLAPLTNQQSHADGTLSDDELRFLAMRADGGFGLVETCAAFVSEDGKAWPGELGVHDDRMIPGLARLARRLHEGGALASAQLFHGGLRADPAVSGLPTISASAYAEAGRPTPRAASEEELARVIEDFARAAERSAEAGLDAIELHGAHGYLLSQFQSDVVNQRADRWGGPLEHRARLIREVTRAVRRRAPSLVLAVRLSPESYGHTLGLELDETIQLARWLVEDGAEVIHLSLWQSARNTTKYPDTHATPLFRAALGDRARIVVAGRIWTREEAEAQLALGADAVALGLSAIAHHDWPRRIERGELVERPPFSPAHLAAHGASPGFVTYLRGWKNFVA